MKTKAIFSLSAILLGMGALPSFAGEAFVSNSHSWQNIFNGYGRSDSSFYEKYNGSRLAIAGAVKHEYGYSRSDSGYAPKYEEKGSSHGIDYRNADFERDSYRPNSSGYVYTAKAASLNVEYGQFKQKTEANSYQTYNFTGGSKSHTVGSGFRY
jgi:hypothetical protein